MEKIITAEAKDELICQELGPCKIWPLSLTANGYGQLKQSGRHFYVHRLAYCEHHGIPYDAIKGKVVRHRCDNRRCINPKHLVIGTQADNMRDMNERGRQVTPRGERNPNSPLTNEQVRQIRSEYVAQSREFGTVALGRKYGVSSTAISDIVTRKSWTHI